MAVVLAIFASCVTCSWCRCSRLVAILACCAFLLPERLVRDKHLRKRFLLITKLPEKRVRVWVF